MTADPSEEQAPRTAAEEATPTAAAAPEGHAAQVGESVLRTTRLNLRPAGPSLIEPARFQAELIEALAHRLRVTPSPTLLRAPTGAGKTLMLSRAVEATAEETGTVWFWFTPYQHLVGQTIAAIERACPGLHAYELATERHGGLRPGDILVANVQLVAASNQSARRIYQDDDHTVGLMAMIDGLRAHGLSIGIVVDEAHLGLSDETVFGRVVRTMAPDRLLLATATPRDAKLNDFIARAGYTDYVTYVASRIDAVNAGLNKRYVLSHVYRALANLTSVADVRSTVLLRAWTRHVQVKARLAECEIATVPLLLVQVENGPGTVEEAVRVLVETCGVPAALIGWHSQDTPDPLLLATIANDTSREVLVFKEAAGTGFDAPRAFTLASMKNVADANFATQFLGRIMRVDPRVRHYFHEHHALPVDLDTGFLYLADLEAQSGFETAVGTIESLRTDMSGSVEQLRAVTLRDGSVAFTNVPASQESLVLRHEEPRADDQTSPSVADAHTEDIQRQRRAAVASLQASLVSPQLRLGVPAPDQAAPDGSWASLGGADVVGGARGSTPRTHPAPVQLADAHAVGEAWHAAGVRVYRRRTGLPLLSEALRTEVEPSVDALGDIAQRLAETVVISDTDVSNALQTAVRGVQYRERATELVAAASGVVQDEVTTKVHGILDRTRLVAEARAVMVAYGFDDADQDVLVRTIAGRTRTQVEAALALAATGVVEPTRVTQVARDVVYLLIRNKQADFERAHREAVSATVVAADAAPLPAALLFPAARPLHVSRKNIYGVRPPTKEEWEAAELEDPTIMGLLRQTGYQTHRLSDGSDFPVAYVDGAWRLNNLERTIIDALEDAEWVLWWHRNPPNKPFSVGVVKATERGRFYPDLVVCVQPYEDARVRQRLIEPKESGDDAVQRMGRDAREYGRVFFLKLVGERMHVRHRDGQVGVDVGRDLEGLRIMLQAGE